MASQIEIERRNRVRLAVAAYAYAQGYDPVMTDSEWDRLAISIRPGVATGHGIIDKFFREEFDPYTGMWINIHPELGKLQRLYNDVYKVGSR